MIDKQELLSKLADLNEEAHQSAMATWLKADRLEEAGLDLPAEDKREEASEEQAEYFEELFNRWQSIKDNYEKFGSTGFMFCDDTYNDSPEKVIRFHQEFHSIIPRSGME